MLKDACVAAGINERKQAAHGLRKIGATRTAENGTAVAEREAMFGWRGGGGMAWLCTRAADRRAAGKGRNFEARKNARGTVYSRT
jgi:hypothetical protein